MRTKLLLFISIFFLVANIKSYSQNIGGFVFDYSNSKNQNSLNVGFRGQFPENFNTKNKNLNFEIFLVGYDWLNNDVYNNYGKNYSSLTLANISTFLVLAYNGLTYGHDTSLINQIFIYSTLAIACLDNSRLKYDIFDVKTSESDYLINSIYFRNKLDYFGDLPNKFWRYRPGFGYEATHIFRKNESDKYAINALVLNLGLDYPIDFLKYGTNTGPFIPSIGLKYIFGRL